MRRRLADSSTASRADPQKDKQAFSGSWLAALPLPYGLFISCLFCHEQISVTKADNLAFCVLE